MTRSSLPSKIFRLKTDPDTHDDIVPVSASRPGGWSPIFGRLSQGLRCADWWQPVPIRPKPATVRQNRGKQVDITGMMGHGLAFSDRAAEILAPLIGDVIELLPLSYEGPAQFRVVNLLDLVDCLDEERSQYERYDNGKIMIVDQYVFKPGSTEGHHLFKCQQCLLHNLVSAEFKALVEETGLIGAYFTPVSE